MSKMIVAIHQPNFFPWLGYFNKIARSEIFIFMDNAQFPKTGGTWVNRVSLLVHQQPVWVTVPVVRSYHGTRLIHEIETNNTLPWREKLLRTIINNYGRAPFFKQVYPLLERLVNYPTNLLTLYNLNAIKMLSHEIGLNSSKFVLGSTLDVYGNATELLVKMVKSVGGTAYLCGGGAEGYQEDHKFALAGLELVYQNFQHPVYPQIRSTEFVPGLSILDALMNCGFEGTRRLIAADCPDERGEE
jgi:hypothetical protein